jgi:hypothetical protein
MGLRLRRTVEERHRSHLPVAKTDDPTIKPQQGKSALLERLKNSTDGLLRQYKFVIVCRQNRPPRMMSAAGA